MRILLFILLLSNGIISSAQKSLEGGLIAGGLYYLGEINQSRQFHSTEPGFGLFLRQNLNKRWSIRANVSFGKLSADDKDFSNTYQKLRNHNFTTSLLESVVQAEFNFIPYRLGSQKNESHVTPYFASGLGFLMVSNSKQPYNITLPLSVGLKLALTKKLEIGLEWSFRKTFSDNIDNLSGQEYKIAEMENVDTGRYKQSAFLYGKDWYSFAGVFITYKIFQSRSVCKAYDF